MPFGILEPRTTLEHVPGTVLLQDLDLEHTSHLKKGSGGDSDIVLVPQPSSNPNDPLNWPLWQRDLLLVLFCYLTNICVGGVGPLIGILALDMVQEFHIDFSQVTLLSGYPLALVGASAPFVSALCHKYGKRPGFLVSMAFLFAGTIWCAKAATYNDMVGGRLIQGVGSAVFEGVTFSLIGDLYFVHERGSRMGIFIVTQVGLVLLPSLLTGVVSVHIGWRWCFWLLAIFLGLGSVLVILFGWETAFNRNEIYNLDTASHDNVQIIETLKGGGQGAEKSDLDHLERIETLSSATAVPRDSLLKRMKPWSTTYTKKSLIKMIVQPFYILLNPVVVWAVLLIAFFQLWNVVINFMLAQIFGPPPYLFNTEQLGYLVAGPMIAGTLSCILFSSLSDQVVRFLAKRNNGVYEPEFRLIMLLIAPILAAVGYFSFGNTAAKHGSPVVLSILWGMGFASCVVITAGIGSYMVDAYRNLSIEVFIVSMSIKNFLFFGFSFFLNNWLAEWGPARVFNAVGGISLALCSTTILVFIYGKRVRAWWHQHDIFAEK